MEPPTPSSSFKQEGSPPIKLFLLDDKMRIFAERVAISLGLNCDIILNSNETNKESLVWKQASSTAPAPVIILIDENNGANEKMDLFYFSKSTKFGVKGRENMPYLEALSYIQRKWPNRTGNTTNKKKISGAGSVLDLQENRQPPSSCPWCGSKHRCVSEIACLASRLPPY